MRFRSSLYQLLLAVCLGLWVGSVAAAQPKPERLGRVNFNNVTLGEAIQLVSEMARDSDIIATPEAQERIISLKLKDATVESAVDAMCRVSGLWYRYDPEFHIYTVMSEEEFSKDIIVNKPSTTRIYELKHQNVADAANAIEALYGDRVELQEPAGNGSYELDGDLDGGGSSSSGSSNSNSSNNNDSGGGSGDDAVEVRRSMLGLEQLRTQAAIQLSEADLVKSNIRQEPPIYVTWNYLHNLLIVRTSDGVVHKDIAELVTALDKPAQQVLLEMKIYNATLGDEERSIFDYDFQTSSTTLSGESADGIPLVQPLATLGLGNFVTEGGAFLFNFNGADIQAKIELMQQDRDVKLVAQPTILAANNKEATLFIGEDRIVVTGASTETVTNENNTIINIVTETAEENIGTEVTVWPRINGDKTVTLDIEQNTSQLNEGVSTLPISNPTGGVINVALDSISRSEVNLTAIAAHGQTIAIGGMIEDEKTENSEQVPVLGDIPVLGKLFRKDKAEERRKEIIILITPWIADDPALAHKLHNKRIKAWTENENLLDDLAAAESEQEPVTHWPRQDTQQALALIRQATGSTACGTAVAESASFDQWQIAPELVAYSLGQCRSQHHYLTRLSVTNTGKQPLQMGPQLFDQGWLASVGENAQVAPGESVSLLLVSDRQPAKLLQHSQERFLLTEAALYDD